MDAPTNIDNKPIIKIEDLKEKNSTILVSVSDIYQEEILEKLKKLKFTNVVCAYIYSFLDDKEFELSGFLIFQVDISYANSFLNENYIQDSLKRRVMKNGYYVANQKDELLYRMVEAYSHPHKKWHLDYIRENLDRLTG